MPPPTATRHDLAPALAATRFREVRWFASIDSTNGYLAAEATAGAAPGLVAVAEEQTAGRGRLGRTWVAPPGASLLASVLLAGDRRPDERHLALTAAALGAIDAVAQCCAVAARMKWPNDLVVDDRKLAGLLAEATASGLLVVGMGCNVDWQTFPDDIARTATACNLEGHAAPLSDLLVAWLRAFDGWLTRLERDGPAGLHAATVAASATLGRRVRVELPDAVVTGEAIGLTELGYLEVRTDAGEMRTVSAGDVVHLRAEPLP